MVRRFLAAHAGRNEVPASALLGKLVGELVAVMAIGLSAPGSVEVECLIVAPDYRKKQIGRVMLRELEALAVRMERDWLTAGRDSQTRVFFERVGFADDGKRMVRKVR